MGGMPTVRLSPAIRRQVEAGPADVAGAMDHPWPHVALFVDGKPVADRTMLDDPLQPDSVIEIWPALSE